MTSPEVSKDALEVIAIEAAAVRDLEAFVDDGFYRAVEAIQACEGRAVLMGVGKSGLVAQKISATFSSTGTPSFFLHPTEGMHGDLGMVRPGDVIVALSYSGETPELLALLPSLKALDVTLVALTGDRESALARVADVVVLTSVNREACPLGLVPTASSTAALVMGDALAICVMKRRGFQEKDFAAVHPGGSLGRRLLTLVEAVCHQGAALPAVGEEETLSRAVAEISAKRFGITAVVDGAGRMTGVISDGDVRRAVEKGVPGDAAAASVMSRAPKIISLQDSCARALHVMEKHQITALFALDGDGVPVAIVHIHDLLGRGNVRPSFDG